jgi:hypothetical protein
MKFFALIFLLLLSAAALLPAQEPPSGNETDQSLAIRTCVEFEKLRKEDSDAAVRHAWSLAAGYVNDLERAGIIDDLLPIPPEVAGALRPAPELDRIAFVAGRFLIGCMSSPGQTTLEALNAAVAEAREEFQAMMRRRVPIWLLPQPPGVLPQPQSCVPETGDGCDFIHLLGFSRPRMRWE